MPLTEIGIRSLTPPLEGTSYYFDANRSGLGFALSSDGTNYFFFDCFGSRIMLLPHPMICLLEARRLAEAVLAEEASHRLFQEHLATNNVAEPKKSQDFHE